MVAVGAITAAPAEALPSELEEFMQSAGDHGVVYASLGTTAIPGDSCQSSKGACVEAQGSRCSTRHCVMHWTLGLVMRGRDGDS